MGASRPLSAGSLLRSRDLVALRPNDSLGQFLHRQPFFRQLHLLLQLYLHSDGEHVVVIDFSGSVSGSSMTLSPTSFGLQGTTDSCEAAGMYTGTEQAGGGVGGGGY